MEPAGPPATAMPVLHSTIPAHRSPAATAQPIETAPPQSCPATMMGLRSATPRSRRRDRELDRRNAVAPCARSSPCPADRRRPRDSGDQAVRARCARGWTRVGLPCTQTMVPTGAAGRRSSTCQRRGRHRAPVRSRTATTAVPPATAATDRPPVLQVLLPRDLGEAGVQPQDPMPRHTMRWPASNLRWHTGEGDGDRRRADVAELGVGERHESRIDAQAFADELGVHRADLVDDELIDPHRAIRSRRTPPRGRAGPDRARPPATAWCRWSSSRSPMHNVWCSVPA